MFLAAPLVAEPPRAEEVRRVRYINPAFPSDPVRMRHMIVVAGGECRQGRTYTETEAYDLTAGRWSTLAPLPAGRHGFGAVTVGPALYFAAGSLDCGGGGRLTDELLVLTLP